MDVEVVKFEELDDGSAEIEVEYDQEFAELAINEVQESDEEKAVQEFVKETIIERLKDVLSEDDSISDSRTSASESEG